MPNVFVSYSRRDAGFVTSLAEGLKSRGKDVWVDVEGIRDAEVFPAALRRAIKGSDTFLFVITPDSVASPFCDQEVTHASGLNKHDPASAGLDHTVRIFDARSLAELRVIVQPDAVRGVAFTADSEQVPRWGADDTVRRWDACSDCENPPALLALAQTRATRTLTARERSEFGVG